jgi:hypothetical protein
MGEPKRHHYLPESYLNRFARDGMLWVYDRERNEFRTQPPNGTAVEGYRYSLIDEAGNKDHSLEKQLNQMEDAALPGILRLERGESLTAKDRTDVAIFTAFLHTRVPDFEKLGAEIDERLSDRLLSMTAGRSPPAGAPPAPEPDPASLPPGVHWIRRTEVEEFLQQVKEGSVPRGHYFTNMIGIGLELAALLIEMNWVAVHPAKSKAFVCSDSPFVTLPPVGWRADSPRGFGVRTPGSQNIVPLSTTLALVMLDRGESIKHITIPEAKVRQMNEAVVGNCDRFAIARDEPHLRSLVCATRLARRERGPRVGGLGV